MAEAIAKTANLAPVDPRLQRVEIDTCACQAADSFAHAL
jgi:hypothetical protein